MTSENKNSSYYYTNFIFLINSRNLFTDEIKKAYRSKLFVNINLKNYFLSVTPGTSILAFSFRPIIIFSSLRCCNVRSRPSFTLS